MGERGHDGDAGAVREAVRQRYASAARARLADPAAGQDGDADPASAACCGGTACCGSRPRDPITRDLYDADTPFGPALAASLGCGNPTALTALHPGDVVLDLGSGGGLDVLLSARRVAPGGFAYGLDMTDDMLALARRNQAGAGVTNAAFLQGEIEDIPLPDCSVDVVISNCVINLSPDKAAVIAEAYRVLRPGGRFAVSDIVLLRDVADRLRGVVALWAGCVSGALRDTEYTALLAAAGFEDASVEVTRRYGRADLLDLAEGVGPGGLPAGLVLEDVVDGLDGALASAFVRARRPATYKH